MMREKIRTVGISVVLEAPLVDTQTAKDSNTPPGVLRAKETGQDESDWAIDGKLQDSEPRDSQATTSVGASRRGVSYNFDLGVHIIAAISEEGLSGKDSSEAE